MAEVSYQLSDFLHQLFGKSTFTRLIKKIAPAKYARLKEYYSFKDKVDAGRVLVDENELRREYRKAVHWIVENVGADHMGDYLEFGVFYGSSLACMHDVLNANGLHKARLFGFDSFEGLPESSHPEDQHWRPGQFKSNYQYARRFLQERQVDWDRVFLLKGWFSDTLTEEFLGKYQVTKASLIMIDCDMYQSAKEALDFCGPLIQDHAIIFFDDWNSGDLAAKNQGEKRAFDEFLEDNPHLKAEEFGAYSYKGHPNAMIFKVSVN